MLRRCGRCTSDVRKFALSFRRRRIDEKSAWRITMLKIMKTSTMKNAGRSSGALRRCLRPGVLAMLWLAGIVSPLHGQRPVIVERLEIHFDQRVPLPLKRLQQQYQGRVFDPQLLRTVRERVLDDLRENGRYFARPDSQQAEVDSSRHTARVYLGFTVGPLLHLGSVEIDNRDSLSPFVQSLLDIELSGYQGRLYNQSLLNRLLNEMVAQLENHGYPLARVSTSRFQVQENADAPWVIDLGLTAQPGDSVSLDYLRFSRQKSNMTGYLQRLLGFRPGQPFDETRISRYAKILRRQEFLKKVDEPLLEQDRQGRYFLDIQFEEAPSTSFDGIIGYIPPPAGRRGAKGYFTGLLNIGVRNIFGGGRKLQVFWQKQDQFSDEFRLAYREPYVLGLPFHTGVGLNRLVRDSTFIEWKYQLDFELPISEVLSTFANFSSRSVFPDSQASRRLRLPRTESVITETGIRWDVRDERENPRRGVLLEIAFGISSQKNKGPEFLLQEDSLKRSVSLQKMRADLSIFLPTFRRQLIAQHAHLEFIENKGEVLRSPDQVWFGGATSVRGFREAQFFGRRVVWFNSEYRFILAPQARFFVFADNAFFSRESPDKVDRWLTSFGLGLRFPGPLGVAQVDFGLEKGAPFREGKVHFRIINEF